jgi:hypothetical protein
MCIRAGGIALAKRSGSRMEAVMEGATLTFINIAAVAALVVLFFVILDLPVTRRTNSNASNNSRTRRK